MSHRAVSRQCTCIVNAWQTGEIFKFDEFPTSTLIIVIPWYEAHAFNEEEKWKELYMGFYRESVQDLKWRNDDEFVIRAYKICGSGPTP